MTSDQLEWFCCAYESGSFARAAKQHFVSRQAFGKAIRALESELRCTLFVRGETGVEPTPVAHAVYPLAKRCLSDLAHLKKESERVSSQRKTMRMALSDGVVELLPADFFDRIEERFPSVEFVFEKHFFASSLDLLSSGEVPFAITPGPVDRPGLDSVSLTSEPLFVAVPKRIMDRVPSRFSLEDLAKLPLFCLDDATPGDLGCRSLCASLGIEMNRITQYRDYEVILRKVNAGQGCVLVPESSCSRLSPDVSLVPFPQGELRFEVVFAYRPDALDDDGAAVVGYVGDELGVSSEGANL